MDEIKNVAHYTKDDSPQSETHYPVVLASKERFIGSITKINIISIIINDLPGS